MQLGTGELRTLWGSRAGRLLIGVVASILVATLIGLAALWPRETPTSASGQPAKRSATVVAVRDGACPGAEQMGTQQQCRSLTVRPAGSQQEADITLGPAAGAPRLAAGDRVVVQPVEPLSGGDAGEAAELAAAGLSSSGYAYLGVDRSRSLIAAAALLAVLALAALRLRGLLAIVGVALSLLLLVAFLVPAILAGHPPLLVALVAASAVTFVTLTLTNGIGAQTLASAAGIAITLLLTCGLALLAVKVLRLDGTDGDLSTLLAQARPGVSLEGVVLCGMVISALGVLADTAVTQASAVMSLRHTDPQLDAGALYRRAVRIGQDHLAATIHTLVLAYAGTVLTLLLVLEAGNATLLDTVNQIDLIEPMIGAIVGCAALIAAVPLTTGLAALFIARIPAGQLPEGHGHAH